jgi:hypothetical protein
VRLCWVAPIDAVDAGCIGARVRQNRIPFAGADRATTLWLPGRIAAQASVIRIEFREGEHSWRLRPVLWRA